MWTWFVGVVSVVPAGPYQGVRSTFDVQDLGGGTQRSAWVSMSIGTYYWVQTGYFDDRKPDWFTMVFDVRTGQFANLPTTNLNPPPAMTRRKHTFSIYWTGNNNLWRIACDGIDVYEIDFGASYGQMVQLYTEASASLKPPRFPTVNFNPAIEVMQNNWIPATEGWGYGDAWGMEGHLQNTMLLSNVINMGSSIPKTNGMVKLW